MSDLDVSVSESSYADARADTPTIGNDNRSDSEDTLSSLSFDENGILSPSSDPEARSPASPAKIMPEIGPVVVSAGPATNALFPVPSPRTHKTNHHPHPPNHLPRSSTTTGTGNDRRNNSSGVDVRVSVTDVDMDEENSLQLDLPPGVAYQPPSIDFPSSPSQLKLAQGPLFMPKEDIGGAVSEDDTSFASTCRAHLDLNFRNGGAVRLTKKDDFEEGTPEPESQQDRNNRRNTKSAQAQLSIPTFELNNCDDNYGSIGPESLNGDVLEDYIEDFYLPMSHESVMSRQQSFRRKVQKTLETAAADSAIRELNKFETMLSSYDEEDQDHDNNSSLGDGSETVLEFSGESTSPEPMKTSTPECDACALSRTPCNTCQSNGKTNKRPSIKRQISSIERDVTDGSPDGLTILSNSSGERDNMPYDPDTSLVMGEWDASKAGITYGRGSNARYDRARRVSRILNFEDEALDENPSLLDIDALCNQHAPNLMNQEALQDEAPLSIMTTNGEEYFIPRATLAKLSSVYDSTNFHTLYTLSGELKHILSPQEIEELVANREHLESVINPNVMAALSWSLNEASLPPYDLSLPNPADKLPDIPQSKTSSISNGFHSRNTSDNSDDEGFSSTKPNTPDPLKNFERGGVQTASFRRRIALAKSLAAEMAEIPKQAESTQDDEELELGKNLKLVPDSGPFTWKSLESLDNLDIEDDIESGGSSEKNSTIGGEDGGSTAFLVRRDSKRFSKKDKEDRVIQGLFVESKNTSNNGTLKRIKVPLQFSEDGTRLDYDFENPPVPVEENYANTKTAPKRRISVDSKILSAASNSELDDASQATDVDFTHSEMFHSCFSNTYKEDDDPTIRSDSGSIDADEITLDLDTPDDMADSILGNLDSKTASPVLVSAERIPELTASEELEEERRWRSFRVGVNEIQIDLKAIQPYRRVLSHGGYFDAEKRVAIILFSGCYLPDRSRREYSYLMDHLFLYVLSTLEELIVDDYILVYLHGAAPRHAQPTFSWLKRCYQLIDRKLRKNLKGLYLVHPSFWLRTVIAVSKPFISTKFSQKIQFVHTLADLCLELPTEHLVIPEPVLQYDFDLKVTELRRQKQLV